MYIGEETFFMLTSSSSSSERPPYFLSLNLSRSLSSCSFSELKLINFFSHCLLSRSKCLIISCCDSSFESKIENLMINIVLLPYRTLNSIIYSGVIKAQAWFLYFLVGYIQEREANVCLKKGNNRLGGLALGVGILGQLWYTVEDAFFKPCLRYECSSFVYISSLCYRIVCL